MRCVFYDVRRALTGRWFLVALAASTLALYMSIGNASHSMLRALRDIREYGGQLWMTGAELLGNGLSGDFGVMLLPALSALPFAAHALTELKCGAIRPVIFRAGRSGWIMGKLCGCLLSGMLLQLLAALLLTGVLHLLVLVSTGDWFPMGEVQSVYPILLRRMLCGGVWACAGCLAALLTETASAAYLAPLCLCYAMVMIGTRFFPGARLLNPVNWITGALWPLLLLLALLVCTLVWALRKKVNACV